MSRPPTPTGMLKLTGGYVPSRHSNRVEAPIACPEPPAWLSEDEAAEFRTIGAALEALGIMAAVHGIALALLASATVEYKRAAAEAAVAPLVIETPNGTISHPIHGLKARAHERLLRALKEFGMSPSAIARVKGNTKPASQVPSRNRTGLSAYKLD